MHAVGRRSALMLGVWDYHCDGAQFGGKLLIVFRRVARIL